MTPRTSVVAAVVERGGRYLIAQRAKGKRHAGMWEFPGGKVERGEELLAAAQRELAEELAVEVLSIGEPMLSVADPGSVFVILFVPVRISGEPMVIEHQALAWATPRELLEYDLAHCDRAFAELLEHQR